MFGGKCPHMQILRRGGGGDKCLRGLISYTLSITFLVFVCFLLFFYQNVGLYIFFQKKDRALGKRHGNRIKGHGAAPC